MNEKSTKAKERQGGPDEDMRQRIIEASIVLMHAYGSERLSISDVAKKAGIARATIYNYFDSKSALIEAAEYSLEAVFWDNLDVAVRKYDRLEQRVAEIAIFSCLSWSDRGHSPWYGFLSPTDEAVFLASHASEHIQTLAKYLSGLLKEAKAGKQVRRNLDIDSASIWIARILYSFAIENKQGGRVDSKAIKSLFRSYLMPGLGSGS